MKPQRYQHPNPVIGVLTVPGRDGSLPFIGRSQYIFEMNEIFMTTQGVESVAIPYNIDDKDLYEVLDRVNGIFLTGGSVDLYNETTGELH